VADDAKNDDRVEVSDRRRWPRFNMGVALVVVVETVWRNASTIITGLLYRILLEPLVDSSSTASSAAVVERYTIIICVLGHRN